MAYIEGTGRDNVGWLTSLNNAMDFMSEHGGDTNGNQHDDNSAGDSASAAAAATAAAGVGAGVGAGEGAGGSRWEFTYWSAGPWFSGNYGYDVDVRTVVVNGTKMPQDSIQMAVLSQQAGVAAPTIYFLAGPERGHTNAASAPFTLTYRGYITRPIKFTCSLSTKIVFQTTCAAGFNCDATFQVAAPTSGQYFVDCTNDGGLQNAPKLAYNSSTDLFLGAAAPAANVFSLRHLYTGYTGPALTLRRSTDNRTRNFSFVADGDRGVDTKAIQAWCASPSCSTFVDTWFDQSPNNWHLGKVVSDFHGGGNKNVSIFDQPELVIEAMDTDDECFLNEAADLLFHMCILLVDRGYKLEDVVKVLKERH